MEYLNYSAIVIGSGISGQYAAIKLSEKLDNAKILLVTKSGLGESNSRYAQGGIVGVLEENKSDSVASHISDTLNAGAGLCDFNTVRYISEKSNEVIHDLMHEGVEFDKDENGQLLFTLEGAHSVRRIMHCNGDATGRGIEKRLTKISSSSNNIEVLENTIAVELLCRDRECLGCILFDGKNYQIALSHVVILAAGGIGQLYKNTTNPVCATGDGIALAYSAGAELRDLEFVQFHPTALAVDGANKNFLISEAVRGEGAKLVNEKGVPFMKKYHELEDLAPRDVVSRANFEEMKLAGKDYVYLDATKLGVEKIEKHFPTISLMCKNNGINMAQDFIPVHPAAHYFMGGVKANIDGRTSVKGLYVIGENASTGLQGANRLASNSLLECVVTAYSLADYVKEHQNNEVIEADEFIKNKLKKYYQELGFIEYDTDALKAELQNIMWNGAGIIRNEQGLKQAENELVNLKSKFLRKDVCANIQEYEFKNMLTVSQLIVASALKRKESRGAHYREDFPNTKDVSEHNCMLKEQGELSFVR